MKKSLVLLTACFVCMAALGDSGNLATSLSGYWAFDETSGGVLQDSSGHGNTSNTSPGVGYWDGKIDDLALWARPLTVQELGAIYNAGLSGQSLLTIIPEPSVPALLGGATLVFVIRRARSKA